MKAVSLVILLIQLLHQTLETIASDHKSSLEKNKNEDVVLLKKQFLLWKQQFQKEYLTGEQEQLKFQTWMENNDKINQHNSQDYSYTLTHNAFSDMTFDEFKAYYHIQPLKKKKKTNALSVKRQPNTREIDLLETFRQLKSLPEEVDWVKKGAVTRVKDQGPCGSCWAFAATAVLEGLEFLSSDSTSDSVLMNLSSQMIVDCDKRNDGCDGGDTGAFDSIKEWGGLCAWEDYEYHARDGECKMNECDIVSGTAIGRIETGFGRYDTMANVALNPTWVSIYTNDNFQFYEKGIFSHETCGLNKDADHAVTIVGYGYDEATDKRYYKVKNSWGSTWGDEGYIYFDMKSKVPEGTCLIEGDPATVVAY